MPLVKDYKTILNQIGDHQSLLQSIKFSADYESFADKANMWETKLGDLDHYVTSLMNVQRKWLYLEPIFASGTLAQEKMRFDRIDRDFKHVLHYIEKDLRVGVLCRYPNLKSLLDTSLDQLSKCQNSLNNFLKEKREQFPRFLFLSDDDLLEVIGQSSKEHVIQSHLKKIFAGINSVKLDESGLNIVAICSAEGEVVNLSNFVSIKHPIEQWLNVLVKEMQRTLKDLLVNCQNEKQAPDPLMYPSQILCLSDSITFTAKCEQAISSMTLPPLLAKYKTQLVHYSSLELNSGQSTSESDNVLTIKLKALLLDTIHYITVLEELINNNVSKLSDWVWQKQLRYYVNSAGDVTIKMANARMDYSYEYLGNAPKLVQTTLTDRCFLTLTQAIHLGMGGNPYGPAGTGKTESVKALGGLLGRQVLVFNCDEGIDTNGMGRILIGLVKTGAWGCFDEFNRLDEATLSAISMIIHPIQVAIRQHQETVEVLEQKVPVNKHCGIFVTLNPAGGAYGGRNKLPDNLKQLFRPVVMTHPDHVQIAKSLLHCDGYQNADVIATKLVTVYDLAGNLLSKQKHYDFGLRAIKTVLSGCGRALKNYKVKNRTGSIDYETEMGIVMQVLKTDTFSKLSFNDSLKFDMIIRDVFKEKSIEVNREETLIKGLEDSFEELGIVKNNRQINKCLEFYEQLQQRMGVVIVGPPSSGKSTIRSLLQKALVKQGYQIKCYSFNPKSMPRSSLLGKTDSDSNQWSAGVLTNYSLQAASENSEVWSWITCDGDIDPDWVESLNSVLDDNRLLSLPSGWRIQFGSNVNFVFETDNLDNASPATISRIGIVFLSEEDLSVTHYIEKFVNGLHEEQKLSLAPLINDHFSNAIKWITNDAEIIINCSKIAIAETGLSQLIDARTKAHFCVALINSLGQQLQEDFREIFAQQVFDWVGETPPPLLLKCHYNSDRDIVDSYYTNSNITIADISNGLPLIYTGQVNQYLDIMRIWISNNRHFLIVGQHGSAKTSMLQTLVNERTDASMVILYCTAHLGPSSVVTKLFENCILVNAHKGKVLKPKKGNLILHLKNLHLLKPDKWGSNILIEFLNQLMVYRGFYDTNVEFIAVENLLIVGSLTVANNVSKRFISNLRIMNVNTPEPEDFAVIISTYLASILKSTFPKKNFPKAKAVKLSTSMIAISEQVKSRFQMNKKHYIFSPHDLTEWCNSITRYSSSGVDDIEPYILECVVHEALGIFGHKLVDNQEYDALCSIIHETLQSQWGGMDYLKKLTDVFYVPTDQSSNLCALNEKDWSDVVQNGISIYERDGPTLSLVVTEDLLHITANVTKTLSMPGGHLLLIGKSGTGRRSAVKITSALRSAKLIEPALDTQPHFNNDLKIAMQQSGLEGEEVYLLIGDHILSNGTNYDKINLLISASEVPELYSTTELDSLVKGLKDDLERENFDGSLIQYFTERVRRKLHVIICLDADNESLWNILQDCLYFTQNCRILWKTHWSKDAIENVPRKIMIQDSCYDLKMTCIEKFPKIYQNTCLDVLTPSRYVTMIKHYEEILEEKLSDIKTKQTKLQAGVGKLNEAKELVKKLKQDAVEQQVKLEEKQSKANAALDMISNTMKNANTHKEEMEVLKNKTEEENQKLMRRKKEIELELSEVEPLIQQARSAVGNIKSEALSEIRSLRAPPEIIRDILEGVLRLMGIQDTSWNSMKTFLAKRGVKEEIRSFDATRISTENRQAVEKLIANKSDSFDEKSAKRASVAAAPLASWVVANVKYSYVLDKIRPLEREQHKLKQNLSEAEAHLGELSAGLLDVDATVAKLKQQLSDYTKEAAEIEIGLKKAQATLASAEGLVSKLSDEFERWQYQLQELSDQMHGLPNDCLIAAAFLVYLSTSPEDKRTELLNVWRVELETREIDIESFFSSERERTLWQSEGISSDRLSLQNAIMILKASIVPLLIDPTSVAVNWIKRHFEGRNIEVTTQNCPKFNTMLELAIRFGKVFIVEEIDDVSPTLLQVLKKELLHQGERKLIKLNGKFMDYNPDFKLILCTRNERMSLPSYIIPLVNLMNFTVTHVGLTEQLLSAAVLQENPDLENRKKQLLREKEELQEKQYHLQNQLLENLVGCKGDILEDKNLLDSLNETKSSSEAIVVALKESTEVQDKLKLEYDIYKDICKSGSSLYFACNEFAKTNILYLLSVPTFTKLFLKALQTYQDLHKTSALQEKHLLSTVYSYVSRGIFKYDRLKMLLYIAHKLYPREIPLDEWNIFLGNVNTTNNDSGNIPTWIPKYSEYAVANLQLAFPDLFKKLKLDEKHAWNDFMNGNDPKFPSHCSLSEFQKVLVVQALRPDLLYTTMTRCALNITGLKSLDPAVLDLHTIYKESNCNEPILLLASSGTNSFDEIGELAQKFQNGIFTQIAMGEGLEAKALLALRQCAESGTWLILKNLHLVTYWLPVLTQNLKNLNPKESFRLWLISEPTPNFYFVLAQNSLKVVCETSQGLKNNLLRTYSNYGSKYIDKLNNTSAKIFFAVSCVHALLQERRKYIPQGWSKPYDFSETDLFTSIRLIEELWNNQSIQTQWNFISGLFSYAVYGGKIENLDDMSILDSYTRQYFSDEILSHRWKLFDLDINLPSVAKFEEYIKCIKLIPSKDDPSIFGLPQNIDRAWEKQMSSSAISELKSLSLCSTITSKIDQNVLQKGLTPFMSVWKKLNQGLDFIRTTPESKIAAGDSPLRIFLIEEFESALNLIHTIHKSLSNLKKMCKGGIIPDEKESSIGKSLLNYETPKRWLSIWNGPKEPTRFMRSVVMKTEEISKWKNENVETLIQQPLSLSSLFRPEAFLAAHKQTFARSKAATLDELFLEANWRQTEEECLILKDMLIEGGVLENGALKKCKPDSENTSTVPRCYISWSTKRFIEDGDKLEVPLYATSDKQQKLTCLQVPTDKEDKDKWIQAGLAFYLEV
ncbi:unnamed protein product [Callosobruchus maculatus]|nr:unnamed protein product [Callosobruchus maculatus]